MSFSKKFEDPARRETFPYLIFLARKVAFLTPNIFLILLKGFLIQFLGAGGRDFQPSLTK